MTRPAAPGGRAHDRARDDRHLHRLRLPGHGEPGVRHAGRQVDSRDGRPAGRAVPHRRPARPAAATGDPAHAHRPDRAAVPGAQAAAAVGHRREPDPGHDPQPGRTLGGLRRISASCAVQSRFSREALTTGAMDRRRPHDDRTRPLRRARRRRTSLAACTPTVRVEVDADHHLRQAGRQRPAAAWTRTSRP